MTLQDRLAMERFYARDCERAKYSFEFDATGLAQTWLVRWDPKTPPQFRSDARTHGRHAFEGTMVEVPAGVYGLGGYGAAYYPNELLNEDGTVLLNEDGTPLLRDTGFI